MTVGASNEQEANVQSSIVNAVRKRLESVEENLSFYAARSAKSAGRSLDEEPPAIRTEFQRDRDRILHTKAFRRLKHKTQVFLAPLGDHFATRLTHTLEVSQVARTISRALNLNEDLTEAIGLGHDMGHTPFGHLGEEMLNQLFSGGFKHNQQSLRIVESLENNGIGLNLTWEVRQGIVNHSKARGDFLADTPDPGLTLEAQVLRVSDAVAYLNHDVEDAIRARVIDEEDLPGDVVAVLGRGSSQRIDNMVSSIITASWPCATDRPLMPGESPHISMGRDMRGALNELREFLFQWVYLPASEGDKGETVRQIMELLYEHYSRHPQNIPAEYESHANSPEQQAVDFISGMTDQYALREAESLKPGIAEAFRVWLPT
jgi:dGTPase